MSQKKKSGKVQEDESTLRLPLIYKRKCESNGLQPHKNIKEKLETAIEEGKLETLQLWQQTGPVQIRSLMDALSDLSYAHLKVIRLWKVDLQDEGLRSICSYVDKMGTVTCLDLLDNKISPLGCQFLGKTLGVDKSSVTQLVLDNNPIGDQGLQNLTQGLRQNGTIEQLSFKFCGITRKGAPFLQQILANIDCKVTALKLMGNALGNQGIYEVLRAVNSCGDTLEKINLADTGMNILGYKQDIGETIEQKIEKELLAILRHNSSIVNYNFRNNWIPDVVARKMLLEVKENKNIFVFELPDTVSHPLVEMHAEIMKKRKPKNKKKAKGKAKPKK